MTFSSGVLLAALVGVIALQVMHRLAGSIAAVVWCAVVLVWGLTLMDQGHELHFFGIKSDPRVFAGLMVGFLGYNGWLVFKELRRTREHG